MASTDGAMSVVPAMLAERLGLPQVTFAREVTVDGGDRDDPPRRRRRDRDDRGLAARLVSVTDQINEPRYPSFKGIMAAKKKPVEDVVARRPRRRRRARSASSAAWTKVDVVRPRARRARPGQVVTDEGDGGAKLVEFLAPQKFV